MKNFRRAKGGDGQLFAIGDMKEMGYVSGNMRVQGPAETAEIGVESQSIT